MERLRELAVLEPDGFLDPGAYRSGPLDFPWEGFAMEPADLTQFDCGTTRLCDRVQGFLTWSLRVSGGSGAMLVDAHGKIVTATGDNDGAADAMALRLAGQRERVLRTENGAQGESGSGLPIHAEYGPGLLLALVPCRFRSTWFGLGLLVKRPLDERAALALAHGWKNVLHVRV